MREEKKGQRPNCKVGEAHGPTVTFQILIIPQLRQPPPASLSNWDRSALILRSLTPNLKQSLPFLSSFLFSNPSIFLSFFLSSLHTPSLPPQPHSHAMRKGTKRKVTKNEEADFPEKENRKESISGTAATRAKRVKASKPHSVPEYLEDKRNLVPN